MKLCAISCRLQQLPVVVRETDGISVETGDHRHRKDKVVVVMGATGTGKSRLAVDLAKKFHAEVINADKMQVYDGLDVVTNKMTVQEQCGVPHHLLGGVDPEAEFSAANFRALASASIDGIIRRGRLPIVAGGSNSYIKALVSDETSLFRLQYDCCFLWVDVSLPVLHKFVSDRVDRMVRAGLVEEVRGVFQPKADYTLGLRKSIGVPELDQFLRAESCGADAQTLAALLEVAIDQIKANTRKLTHNQLRKIHMLRDIHGWNLHRLDATGAVESSGQVSRDDWERRVVGPSMSIVGRFLLRNIIMDGVSSSSSSSSSSFSGIAATAAMVAAAAAGVVETAITIG
ncbi:adenylate isopentenyltransferase 5, chloroplastic-like [Nymphaea colorata]|nr:adenylate isopentenyltransferase 5, chloroplastic-like [Nymphaea colorata]